MRSYPHMLTCVALMSCSASSESEPPAGVSVDLKKRTIFIIGELNDSVADDLEQKFDGSIKKIIITSAGGRDSSSLRMATFVMSNNIDVTIRKFCFSGCGHIFIASKNRTIENSSLVGFHHSAIFSESQYQNIPDFENIDLPEITKKNATQQRNIYKLSNVSSEFINLYDNMAIPLCYINKFPKKDRSIQIAFHYDIYLPTQETLSNFGIYFSSEEKLTSERVQEIVRDVIIPRKPDFSYVTDVKPLTPSDARSLVSRRPLGACSFVGR